MRKLRVLVPYDRGSCRTPPDATNVRLLRPLSHPTLADTFAVTVGNEWNCSGIDVVLVHGLWNSGVTPRKAKRRVEQARRAGARLVYVIDDHLLDHSGISIEQKAVVGLLAREADGLIVSTAALKERFKAINPNIHVVPYAQDDIATQTPQHYADQWRTAILAIFNSDSTNPTHALTAPPSAIDEPCDVVDVDLILGVHNEPHLAANCIESLLANTNYPRWRLLIIDDQSDDLTREMLVGYASQYSNIVVHRNETNLGFVGTYNRGIALAKAKYVVFVNSDIIVPPGWLGRLVDVAEADPSIALVNPLSNEAANLSVPLAPGTNCFSVDKLLADNEDRVAFDIVTAIGFCLLIRRDALERHGALDDVFGRGYCEDSDLHMRLTSNGWRSVAAPNTYVYHLGSGTYTSAGKQQRYEENITIFMSRWESRWREDLRRFCEADPLGPIRGQFAIEPPAPPSPPPETTFTKAFRVVARNRNKLLAAMLRPRRAIRALRRQWMAPPPAPVANVPSPQLPRQYLERTTPRTMPSVIFLLEGLQTGGGCLRVVELANQMILAGINAQVAVCCRDVFDPEVVRGALFSPMLFDNHDDLMDNVPTCDVAIATLWSTAVYARKLVDAGRAKTAFHFLQDFEPWFYDTAEERAKVFATYPLVEHRIATSHWLRDLVRQHGYDATVIPLSFDALRFYRRPAPSSDRIRIIAMGRPETPRRGFQDVMATFGLVHQRRPNVDFALFGTKSLAQYGDLGFPYVDLGIIHDRKELCHRYSQSDIFLDASRFQAFGLPALEAMACQVACVLTDVGGVHEYARHQENSLLVPPGDPQASADAIVRLIDDAPLRNRLATTGRETIEKMPPRRETAAWIRALADVCPTFQGIRDSFDRLAPHRDMQNTSCPSRTV
jgi:GT2 family glycosyltransferase/glycosyltransferase involved in cell wall biosynthesis